MQRYEVTKVIEFSYGHRLLNHDGKCRYLHGHNGMLEVDIAAESLDQMGMVIDFGRVNDVVKSWVDKNLDHRMLLCRADPLAQPLIDAGEPIFLMDENPTAENIARLIWQAAQEAGLEVGEVRLWETSTSRATFQAFDARD
jgi:6-pyruvoyltetrahydropterin/6-carboxytetrahydropterin synthase